MKTAKETILIIFSIIIVLATLVWFGMLFFVIVPEGNRELINFAAGIFLGSGWTQVLGWWFGSSKGSADKTESVNKAAEDMAKNTVVKSTEQIDTKINPL